MPATQHLHLKPGDLIEIFVKIRTSLRLSCVFVKLHEFGTPVYEVMQGPSAIDELLSQVHPQQNTNISYYWRLRVQPRTVWTNGTAPLEVFTQFTDCDGKIQVISFDVFNAYIEYSPFQTSHNATVIQLQPFDFQPLIVSLVVIVLYLFSRSRFLDQ